VPPSNQGTNAGTLLLILIHSGIATMAIQTVVLNRTTAIALPSRRWQKEDARGARTVAFSPPRREKRLKDSSSLFGVTRVCLGKPGGHLSGWRAWGGRRLYRRHTGLWPCLQTSRYRASSICVHQINMIHY